MYKDRSIQTTDVNTCTYPQEGVKILTSNSNHSGKIIICKFTPKGGGINLSTNLNQSQSRTRYYVRSPREGAVKLCTDLNQSEPTKLFKIHLPREGAVNLCTVSNQSESEHRIHPSGKTFNHSIASCNKAQFLPVSNCTSKPYVPIRKYNTDISGSPSGKNFSILDMLNASGRIIPEIIKRIRPPPLSRIPLGRSRPARRQQARRPSRMSSAKAGDRRELKYATIIANFRKQRMIKTRRPTRQVNRVSIGQRIEVRDKKSLPGLVGVLDAEILSELTDEDVTLRLMKIAISNRDFEGFARIDAYTKTFWDLAAVIDGCILIDDRIAIPSFHSE